MTKHSEEFRNFLKGLDGQNANILKHIQNQGSQTKKIDEEYHNSHGIDYGLYITSAFYRGYPDQSFDFVFNKTFQKKEIDKNDKKKSSSDIIMFSRENIEIKENDQQYPNNKNKYLFEFFFPISNYVNNQILLFHMCIKKLPFELKYIYASTPSGTATTPYVNEKPLQTFLDTLNSNNTNAIENIFRNIINQKFLNEAYDVYIQNVSLDKTSYSDFINKININPQQNSQQNVIKGNYKHTILNVGDIEKNDKYKCINKNKATNKVINFNLRTNQDKTIKLTQEEIKALYSKANIYPELTTLPVDYPGLSDKIPNYYDISFDCKELPVFMYSHFSPGFNVIDFMPKGIYAEKDVKKIENNNNPATNYVEINFDEVYKEIFYNKIIELIPSE